LSPKGQALIFLKRQSSAKVIIFQLQVLRVNKTYNEVVFKGLKIDLFFYFAREEYLQKA